MSRLLFASLLVSAISSAQAPASNLLTLWSAYRQNE